MKIKIFFIIPQPLKAVAVLFLPIVSGRACIWAGGRQREKFVWAVSQKPQAIGS